MRFAKLLIEEDYEIKNHTSFKIGGKIAKIYFPETVEEVLQLANLPVIGNLSNTLVSSFGYNKELLSSEKLNYLKILKDCHSEALAEESQNIIIAGAGVKGPKLAQTACEKGLSGLEFMIGFPGSVGGEVYMNAGAHGQEISNRLKSAKIYCPQKGILTLKNEDLKFGYRTSICQSENYTVLEAEFDLIPKNPDEIKKQMEKNLEFRKEHQPSLAQPNCGSIFKNPKGLSAGKLLDECYVKELKVGGAKVWENHANFIINTGNATSTDVLSLMFMMQNRVKDKFGIELLPEIKYLGDNNEEVELCKLLKVK